MIFAADSIPAILAITQDHFIVLPNVFAILGLRSLYFFALAGMMDKFSICLRDLL
jgi:tellurite resistance protein TerC